jgi:hypothetical protein
LAVWTAGGASGTLLAGRLESGRGTTVQEAVTAMTGTLPDGGIA